MENSKNFIKLLKQLIQEALQAKAVLLESPVRCTAEVLVEHQANKILKSNEG
tara:strand:- start:1256 stop:1411 length:156 start_codon:yes stop_codon:yes gene_type:complete